MATLTRRNIYLEKQIESLKSDLENAALDCENVHAANLKLEKQLSETSCAKDIKTEVNEDLQKQLAKNQRKLTHLLRKIFSFKKQMKI